MDKENVDGRTDFLFTLSHEIKNALNIINAMCCMVENNIDDRERALKYLNRICSLTEHISEILDRNLDIAVFNTNRFHINQEPFKLNKLKEELYEFLLPLAKNKNIDFKVICKSIVDEEVVGDYDSILQLLINIVTNSIKYTPYGGMITIKLKEEPGSRTEAYYEFVCIDNGIGMKEDFIKYIFEPFARAEDDRVRQIKGSGIGMAVVKELVDAMGGNIHISSAVDLGTTVTIRLKLKKYIRKG